MDIPLSLDSAARLRERLSHVLDPELGASIVELGMVGSIKVSERGRARVEVNLTIVGCPLRAQIERDVREAARSVEGIEEVELIMGVLEAGAKSSGQ